MINIKDFITGKGFRTVAPVTLGVTSVSLGSVALSKYDNFPTVLQEELKKANLTNKAEEQITELKRELAETNKETVNMLNTLTAQNRAILDTKNIDIDLSPIIKKLDDMARVQATTYDFDFVDELKESLKELGTLLRAQKTPVLSTVKNDPVKDYGKEFKQLVEALKALKLNIQNIKGQQSEHTEQLKEIKNINLLRDEKTVVFDTKILDKVNNELVDIRDDILQNKIFLTKALVKIFEDNKKRHRKTQELINDLIDEHRLDNTDVQILMEQNTEILERMEKHLKNVHCELLEEYEAIYLDLLKISNDKKAMKDSLKDFRNKIRKDIKDFKTKVISALEGLKRTKN